MGRKRAHKNIREEEDDKGFGSLFTFDARRLYKQADSCQKAYIEAIRSHRFVGVDAGAGTGKTTYATLMGLELLKEGMVDGITYIRYADERSLSLGFLPGDKESGKEAGYMQPFIEALTECGLQTEDIARLAAAGALEMTTDIFLRGTNRKRRYVIIDEAQNGSIGSLKLTVTRVHDNGKVVCIGHTGQQDSKLPKIAGLIPFQVFLLHMDKKPWAAIRKLPHDYRGEMSRWSDMLDHTIQELTYQDAYKHI